jgi:hypothetical protein
MNTDGLVAFGSQHNFAEKVSGPLALSVQFRVRDKSTRPTVFIGVHLWFLNEYLR